MADAKRTLTFVGGTVGVLAAVIGGFFGREIVRSFFPSRNAVLSQQTLNEVADKINRTLPIMVDKDTELTSTVGLEGFLVYNYRLVNHDAGDLDSHQLAQLMRPQIVNAACSTPQTRDTFLKHGVTMRYVYSDRSRRFITNIDVKPSDCGF